MNRIVFSPVLAAMVAAAALMAQVEASYIELSEPDNVASLADIFSSPGTNIEGARDGKVSDGVPGEASFEDGYHFVFNTPDAPAIILQWAAPQNLSSVQAYVCHGGPADTDRTVSSIEFLLDLPGGVEWDVSIVVPTADTNEIGGLDLTKADGNWQSVSRVGFAFTASSGQGPRVGEVLALTAVPEPSAMLLLVTSLIGLLAYAWRKRK